MSQNNTSKKSKRIAKTNKDIGPPKLVSSENDKTSKTLSANPKQALDTFGTKNVDIINITMNELANTLPTNTLSPSQYINAALATAHELNPQDSYERMLVTQIIASHSMVMEFSRRAMLSDQTAEGVDMNVNRLTKLMRALAAHTSDIQLGKQHPVD